MMFPTTCEEEGSRGKSRCRDFASKEKNGDYALAGVAQWIECRPVNQGVAGLIPSEDICLGCGPGPQ